MEQYDVFLSHNSRDKPLVEAVAAWLHQVGVRSWLDKQRLTPGGRWQDELAQGLTASSGCAVFVGPHGLGDWVREELAVALDLAAKDRNYRLFLVLLPGTPEPFDPSTLPPFLTTRTWVDMRRGIDDVSAFATLLAAIRGAAPSPHTDDARLSPDSSAVRPSPLHNFPAEPTPLIGRVRETAEVRTMLRREDVRVLTLTGPGGTGKTRVALHAAELMHEFTDGVYFVNLAPVSDQDLVSAAVAAVLNVQESAERNLLDSLSDWLRPRRAALLLDNFEHVLGAAPIVASLVRAAPGLKVLATSRAPLRISGEHEYPIHPLETPDPSRITTVESLLQNDAVALFVARAKAVKPGFELMHENAYAAAAICVSLDGLPLAIELAAARVRMFAPQAMLSRLTNRLKLLTGGARDLPTRQQTLRGAIDWSYSLLAETEQQLFARLSVFAGACTLESAEAVCKPDDDSDLDLIEGLDSLVNNSLLRQEESDDGEPSFAMLQTIREYAADRLTESGEGESVRRRHAEHQLWLAETARPELVGPDQREWIRKLEHADDELRTALSWATSGGDSRLALRFGAALWRFWDGAGQYTEGREWLQAALSSADGDSHTSLAEALNGAGWLASAQGDHIRARSLFERSLALRREQGDEQSVAGLLLNLGSVAGALGEYDQEVALCEQSLSLYQALGDRRAAASALGNLALALEHSDPERAESLYTESLALFEEVGDHRGAAITLTNLGWSALLKGGHAQAEVHCKAALRIYGELRNQEGIAYCLEALAATAGADGRLERAALLWGAAEGLRDTIQAPLPAEDRIALEPFLAHARTVLDEDSWRDGQALPLVEIVAQALEAWNDYEPKSR